MTRRYITQNVEQQAQQAAERKLQWIIDQYGDDDGELRKPYYLAQLVEEARRQISLTLYTMIRMDLEREESSAALEH